MDQMLSGVDKLVEIDISVGQPTSPKPELPGNGASNERKRSIQEKSEGTQHVSIKLPNMT